MANSHHTLGDDSKMSTKQLKGSTALHENKRQNKSLVENKDSMSTSSYTMRNKSSALPSKLSVEKSYHDASSSMLGKGIMNKRTSVSTTRSAENDKKAVSFKTCNSESTQESSFESVDDSEIQLTKIVEKKSGHETDKFKELLKKMDIEFEKSLQRYQNRINVRRSLPWLMRRKLKWKGFDKDESVLEQIDVWYRERFSKSSYIQENKNPPREEWAGKWDCALSVLGYMVGIGNLRFALLLLHHGGLTVIFPQLICMCVMGYPLMLMEISLGQYTSLGPTASWNFCKLLQGLSFAMLYNSFLEAMLYATTLAYVLYYMCASFSPPWHINNISHNASFAFEKFEDYYNEFVIHQHEQENIDSKNITELHHDGGHHHIKERAFSNFSDINGIVVLCSFVIWTALMLAAINGVPTVGKLVRWTATLPFFCLAILLVLALTLPGTGDGIAFGMAPRPEKLGELETWVKTAEFVFYSMGVSYGGHTTLASYNSFHAPVLTDTFIAACGDMLTCWLFAFLFFALFGFLAQAKDVSPEDLDLTDKNLFFTIYPTILDEIGGYWNVFFFFTLLLLGKDGAIVVVETVVTSIIDTFSVSSGDRKYVVVGVTLASFLLSIPLFSGSGPELSEIYGNYQANLLLIGLCQCLAIGWVYGAERFIDEVEFMVGWDVTFLLSYEKCKMWWIVCWKYLAPLMITLLIFDDYLFASRKVDPDWPIWAQFLFYINEYAAEIIVVGTVAVLMATGEGGKGSLAERYRALRLPNNAWGPAGDYHRKMIRILEISNIDKAKQRQGEIKLKRDKRFLKNINI